MPLLRRQAFVKQKPPPDLSPDEEVFHCNLTNEIFREYEDFFERVILCNSLVWSCELTGRPQLTYQEALESEERAKKQLATFPDYLTRPILYLANLTHRSRLADVNDDVFVFAKDRFFIGEAVDVFHVSGARKVCKVLNVIPPTGNTPQKIPNGDGEENSKSPKSGQKSKHSNAPSRYQYLVQEKKTNIIFATKADNLVRKKGVYTREKSKLFLKQHTEMADSGLHVVKPIYMRRFKLQDINFRDYFPDLPTFATSIAKKKPAKKMQMINDAALLKKKKKEEKKERKRMEKEAARAATSADVPKMRMSAEERQEMKDMKKAEKLAAKEHKKEELDRIRQEFMANKMAAKEELKKRLDEEKQRMKEERLKEREKLREEKRVQAEMLKEWSRPREDMELDDLKDLPNPTPVRMDIPTELFGDAVMVMEFLYIFKNLLDSEQFPDTFNLDTLNKAIMQRDTNGPLLDLLQFLLTNIFIMQEEEEADEEEIEKEEKEKQITADLVTRMVEKGPASYSDLVEAATAASQWPQMQHGTPLKQFAMDSFTVTEILRLHFLSSGAKTASNLARYHYQQRGGYSSYDDAGLEFRKEEPAILKTLAQANVFDLNPEEKLKILRALINQLLTFVASRDFIDDNCERLRQERINLRKSQSEELRREREVAADRYKKRLEERAREREKDAQRIAKKKEAREKLLRAEMEKNGQTGDGEDKAVVIEDEEEDPEVSFKEADGENTEDEQTEEMEQEEQEQLKAKEMEEEAKRKEEYMEKEKELTEVIQQLQHGTAIYPIGRDRLFRRYWAFSSVPGIFIEDQDQHVPDDFFEPVSQANASNSFQKEETSPGVPKTQIIVEEKNNSSDKENDSFDAAGAKITSPLKKDKSIASDITNMSVESCASISPIKQGVKDEGESPMEVEMAEPLKVMNLYQQIAHRNKVRWAFFSEPQDLELLTNNLNPRGIREGSLKQALVELKERIVESVKKCPKDLLTQAREEGEAEGQQTCQKFQSLRSRNRATQGRVTNNSAEQLMELNLREMLLDTEERAYAGALGTLKVKDRHKWREAIEDGSYDPQCDDVSWSGKVEGEDVSVRQEKRMKTEDGEDDDDEDDDALPVVKDLAKALLQISQGMEPKYMQPPLGESEAVKKAKAKAQLEASKKEQSKKEQKKDTKKTRGKKTEEKEEESDDDKSKDDDASSESSSQAKKSLTERWEESLMSSTSLSQVFLHLATLEKSILWGKSALNARCRICRRKGDAEQMLLCDGCDRGHHMYCLKPPLKNVPKGDWFCTDCKPKQKQTMRSPRKGRRKSFTAEDSEDEEEADSDEEEDEDDSDDDSDEEEDSDDDSSEEEDSDEEEEEEEEVQKPAKIKLGRAVPKPRSGRSTPSSVKVSGRKSAGSAKNSPADGRHSRSNSRAGGANTSLNNSRSKSQGRNSLNNSTSGRSSRNSGRKRRESDDSDAESQGSGYSNKTSKSRSNEQVIKMKAVEELVQELNRNPDTWPFCKPVTKRDAPDYFDIIKTPMDLSTVRNKINKFQYNSAAEMVEDVRLIFKNCSQYNLPTADEFKLGTKLSRWFEKKVKEEQLDSEKSPSGAPPAKRSRTRTT